MTCQKDWRKINVRFLERATQYFTSYGKKTATRQTKHLDELLYKEDDKKRRHHEAWKKKKQEGEG